MITDQDLQELHDASVELQELQVLEPISIGRDWFGRVIDVLQTVALIVIAVALL